MVQYDISEPVRNYRICLWEKILFYWSRMEQEYFFVTEIVRIFMGY